LAWADAASAAPTAALLAVSSRLCHTDRLITFCLIHGQWHDGWCWEPVVGRLEAYGHDVVAPDMPFDDPLADYPKRARPASEALATADGPVVVVGHSIASAEAALVAAERHPALLVHLCPRFGTFATPPGAPAVFRDGFPFPPKGADGRSVWTPERAIEAIYPRLPPDTAGELVDRLRPSASAVGDYPLTQHPKLPTALIYTADDEFSRRSGSDSSPPNSSAWSRLRFPAVTSRW